MVRISSRLAATAVLSAFFAARVACAQATVTGPALPDDPATSLSQQSPSTDPQASSQTPSQTPAGSQETEEDRQRKAQEQIAAQEKQRVMGVMSAFNTTSNKDALPLTSRQKYQLFFKSASDPWPFGLSAVLAGIGQADDDTPEYGQGMQGYAKRFGADYANYFIGNFFGNAVLPSILHEDPRFFQKSEGSVPSRALWAAESTVWCRRDNGSWGPNYANIAGNLIGSAIGNVYAPSEERSVGNTIENGVTVTLEGAVGAEVIEFWPDIARHYKRKHAEKLARQAALQDAQGAAAPTPPTPKPQTPTPQD